ncbi:MAG: hypothetical protein QF357_09465, partial [Dehalococcoidia bacterium]|nr:hypothetical protein [Dehalococcoidia bacterium]
IDNVLIAAIDDDASLQEAIKIEPSIRVASACVARLKEAGSQAVEECAEFGYHMVTLASFNHTRELVELGQRLGMEVRSSGISNREQMIVAVEIGANGMTINWPDWLQDYVRDM